MTRPPALDKIASLYSDNVKRDGAVSKAVGWKTPESQALRFAKLTSVVDDDGAGFTVNDYGCGYGAHLEYPSVPT
jgi:hypothetical protein